MGAGKKLSLIVFGFYFLSLWVVGCGGDGGCGCDLPCHTNDWHVDVTFGNVPDEIPSYPIFVDVTVNLLHLETGSAPPDGMMVTLSVSPGSFDNGLTEINQPLSNGRVSAVIQIDAPAAYRLTISIPGETRTVTVALNVGL